MAAVFHRTWAKSAIPILYGEGFENNQAGFIWVANVPIEPYSFGNVLSDEAAKAGGDCVIQIVLEDAVLEECQKVNRGGGHVDYKVPADKLNAGVKELYATSYKDMTKEKMVAGLEELKKALANAEEAPFLGWHIPERWERAIELFDKAAPLP